MVGKESTEGMGRYGGREMGIQEKLPHNATYLALWDAHCSCIPATMINKLGDKWHPFISLKSFATSVYHVL